MNNEELAEFRMPVLERTADERIAEQEQRIKELEAQVKDLNDNYINLKPEGFQQVKRKAIESCRDSLIKQGTSVGYISMTEYAEQLTKESE